jgi:hypothetical protein
MMRMGLAAIPASVKNITTAGIAIKPAPIEWERQHSTKAERVSIQAWFS